MNNTTRDILAKVRAQFPEDPPARLGVAVSGGGDSVALLHILSRCFDTGRVWLAAAAVDHGLRPGSGEEASAVGALAKKLGVPHSVLRWEGWDGGGNLQDHARRARYRLLSDWAKAHGIDTLALGHTRDDQAETVLMRLARAPGVTGLAAMPARRSMHGITLLRPLLGLSRSELRDYLVAHGLSWAEDPSNEDARFDRIKARQALAQLATLGITAQSLADVASNMAMVDDALDGYSLRAARETARVIGGDVVFDRAGFAGLPEEIARRLLVRSIVWISSAEYPPRRAAVNAALVAIGQGRSMTLGGCRVISQAQKIWVCREYNAVRRLRAPAGGIWDRRWRLHGGQTAGCELRVLGRRGLQQCANWRDTQRPFAALTASPSVWREDMLVAAPLAGMPAGWRAELVGNGEAFFKSLLSH